MTLLNVYGNVFILINQYTSLPLGARDWDAEMSCKYYYRGGLCANSRMDKPFCVGEDKCDFVKGKISVAPETGTAKLAPKQEIELPKTQVFGEKGDDSLSQWMGVYCPHYQRFFCTGGADGCKSGCCATAADYERALAEHMEKLK